MGRRTRTAREGPDQMRHARCAQHAPDRIAPSPIRAHMRSLTGSPVAHGGAGGGARVFNFFFSDSKSNKQTLTDSIQKSNEPMTLIPLKEYGDLSIGLIPIN